MRNTPAITMALNTARRAMAKGGMDRPKHKKVHFGPIKAAIPGRTDRLPVHVYSGSYVLPADIVSGLGEGNTEAGYEVIKRMFAPQRGATTGGRISLLHNKYGIRGPYHEEHTIVPVIVAGGEYILTPEEVEKVGNGDLDKGHATLDAFVKSQRKSLRKKLAKLPGPAQD